MNRLGIGPDPEEDEAADARIFTEGGKLEEVR